MSEKKIPHVHAECIKAWADGAKIEYKNNYCGGWLDCKTAPMWSPGCDYRVKPEPKPDFIRWVHIGTHVDTRSASGFNVEVGGAYSVKSQHQKLQLTFDGETGKLKSADVVA